MSIDVAFSMDTTGSMFPAIAQVRRSVDKLAKELFDELPDIRIAIMAHGDYCDGDKVLTIQDFTNKPEVISRFVKTVGDTYGGDADEAYEFVLNRARTLSWTGGTNKALVMIGDCCPHAVGYKYGKIKNDLDWKNEAKLLNEAGIKIYPVQALRRRSSDWFYDGLSAISSAPKLELEQFSEVNDLITALCYSRAGQLERFEKQLNKRGGVSYNVIKTVDSLAGRKPTKKRTLDKAAVDPSRFQVLTVHSDCDIQSFVEENGLLFKKGRGFYEFTKRVLIQDYKEVIAQDLKTGSMFSGDKARQVLGIPVGTTAKVSPDSSGRYKGYVQSTSNNRKLLSGTNFLYEVDYSR